MKLVGERGSPVAVWSERYFERFLGEYDVFGGRQSELARLRDLLRADSSGYAFVTGTAGFGKTALLVELKRQLEDDGVPGAFHFITTRAEVPATGEACLTNLCEQMLANHRLSAVLPEQLGKLKLLYQDLLGLSPGGSEPLVVILDGLDEALGWEAGREMFPENLGDGVHVVFSAREIAGRSWLEELRLDLAPERMLRLGGLDRGGIREAVERGAVLSRNGAVLEQATDEILRISEGDPFYVSDLIAELRGKGGEPAGLHELPVGHSAYLRRWWNEGLERCGTEPFADLMGTLAAARGPLLEQELPEVSEEDALRGRDIGRTLGQAARYLSGDARAGYQLAHPRIREFIEATLHDERSRYQRALRDWCSSYAERGWPPDTPRYVLAHYPDHLATPADPSEPAGELRGQLYELADDAEFRRAHEAAFPDELASPLRVVALALAAAADADDIAGVARFALRLGVRMDEITERCSLVAALDRGDVKLVLQASDQLDADRRALLHLLAAWAELDGGSAADAAAILERLAQSEVPRLDDWEEEAAAALLARLHPLRDQVAALAGRLLDEKGRRQLCVALAALCEPPIVEALERQWMLAAIGEWWLPGPLGDGIQGADGAAALGLATALVPSIHESFYRALALVSIFKARLARGELDEAAELTDLMEPDQRATGLAEIAERHAIPRGTCDRADPRIA